MATTPVFIGVGGTGQTVLAAYLRLSQMAGFTPAPFYIVDSDTEGPLGSTLVRLRSEVDEVVGGNEPAERWMVDPYPTADAERKSFGGLFGNLSGERRDLFHSLFSEEAEQTPVRTGMYGRPSIGATCIRYKLLQQDDDLTELKNSLQGGEKHVILVGSCFGGTGSGGVPMLASEFAKLNREAGYSLKVDAFVFLPWFRLVLPEGDLAVHDKHLHERLNQEFEPNAAAGIHYFKRQLKEYVNTLVLLGVPDRSQVERESSESAQEEEPHILNLLAAVLIQNHFVDALKPPRGVTGYWHEEEEGLDPRSLLIHRDGSGDPLSLSRVIHRAFLRYHWLGILSTFFTNYSKIPGAHRPLFLEAALRKLEGTTLNEDQVLSAIADHLSKEQARANEHLEWIRSMGKKSNLFPFPEGAERIQNPLYDQITEEPLAALGAWCDDRRTVQSFQKKDFQTPEGFCEKLTGRFLDHLNDVFSL
jgi:hypothetical protein